MHRFSRPLVLFALATVLLGADAPSTTTSMKLPKYLAPDAIDAVGLLPDPPAADSPENRLEYDVLKRVVAVASDADKQRMRDEIEMDVFIYRDVLGPWFTAENCPHAAAFFKQAASDAKFFSDRAKRHFRRARPSARDDFKPFSSEDSFSYPSGHSTRGTLWAELLADMYPQQREALLARGRLIGYDRMLAGVHFPTDVYAGRIIGHAVAQKLLANVSVRAELDQVKAEMDEAKSNATQATTPPAR